ncbi:hypothetical protein RUND412_006096 [Rhizina undulata]
MSPTTATPPGRVEIEDSAISSSSHPPPAELGDSTDIDSDGYTTSNPSTAESFLGIVDSSLSVTPTLSSDSTSSTLIELGVITDINTDEYTASNPPEAEPPDSSLEIVDFSSRVILRLSTFSTYYTLVELGDAAKEPPFGSNQLLKANEITTPKRSTPAAESSASKSLTSKELKEKKKAEKAAPRAQTKGDVGVPRKSQQQQARKVNQRDSNAVKGQSQQKGKKGTPEGIVKTKYVSETSPYASKKIAGDSDLEVEENEKKKQAIFGIDNAHSDAIENYETPKGATLNRHLPGHYLSHQVNYLLSARPMSIAMGNTIRWLKTEISKVFPDLAQEAAKKALSFQIGAFIHEKLTAADEMILRTTVDRYINDDNVIVTYGKSQVIKKTLIEAYRRDKQFLDGLPVDKVLILTNIVKTVLSNSGASTTYTKIRTEGIHSQIFSYEGHFLVSQKYHPDCHISVGRNRLQLEISVAKDLRELDYDQVYPVFERDSMSYVYLGNYKRREQEIMPVDEFEKLP